MAKPRKRYRPKPIGRPMTSSARNELILPAYSALTILQTGDDREALESARHTLAALLDYMLVAKPGDPISAALQALHSIVDRHERTGTYRATGPELQALRAGVTYCDEKLGTLRTDQVISAVAEVNRVLGF